MLSIEEKKQIENAIIEVTREIKRQGELVKELYEKRAGLCQRLIETLAVHNDKEDGFLIIPNDVYIYLTENIREEGSILSDFAEKKTAVAHSGPRLIDFDDDEPARAAVAERGPGQRGVYEL